MKCFLNIEDLIFGDCKTFGIDDNCNGNRHFDARGCKGVCLLVIEYLVESDTCVTAEDPAILLAIEPRT